ncbi:MAG: penicillin-binding protein activator LpoB [Treponema sp.]|nr:penicillin-binding protein activator LpoB [Treponema sp.]
MKNFVQYLLLFLLVITALTPCFTQQYYSGDGGRNIRLAIYEPQPQGNVSGDQLTYIQSMLNNNFNRFSAIRLIDQQYLERIIAEQDAASSGRFSDEDYIRIGALVNAQYMLFGTIQSLSADRYRLHLSITESNEGLRVATFMKDGSITSLVYEATDELLKGLGVILTAEGRNELQRQQKAAVQAEQRMARDTARNERASKTGSAFDAAKEQRIDHAHRSFLGTNVFFKFEPGEIYGGGLEVEAFVPIFPFITLGVSANIGLMFPDDYKIGDGDFFSWSVSPVAGIIWPANQSIKIFSDVLFDFGNFGALNGIFAEWFTLSYDIGIQFHIPNKNYVLGMKYRGSFYDEKHYTSTFVLGVSLWWGN